jgi:hypothetical protein
VNAVCLCPSGALHFWSKSSDDLSPDRFREHLHIPTRQYARIVRDWIKSIGMKAAAKDGLRRAEFARS